MNHVLATLVAAGVAAQGCSSSSSAVRGNPDAGIGDTGTPVDAAPPDTASLDGGGSACPSGRGPAMVAIPAADGGKYCIDSTEVTLDQYQAFLQDKNGDTSGQAAYCGWNTTYGVPEAGPCPYPDAGDRPVVCVDWCDAVAFCTWAGKRLCQDPFLDSGLDPVNGEWVRACSAAGKNQYLAGSSFTAGNCVDSTVANATEPVASLKSCQSSDPAYVGVFDLLGNVAEWTFDCASNPPAQSQPCLALGGSVYDPVAPTATPPDYPIGCNPDERTAPFQVNGTGSSYDLENDLYNQRIGFRCCADH